MEEVNLFTCHLQNAKRNAVYGTSPPALVKTKPSGILLNMLDDPTLFYCEYLI